MRGRARVVGGLVALVALLATPAGADHSWGGYHWARTSNPVTLTLLNNTNGPWPALLGGVGTDWSQSAVLDAVVAPGSLTGKQLRRCPATTGQVQVCNYKYGYNGWLGLAGIYVSGSHITAGYVKVNDSYFGLSAYNNEFARRHVLCQEVGHEFGLDHQPAGSDSCMNDKDRLSDPAADQANQHDFDMLASIYAHLDDTSTVAAAAPAATPEPRGHGHARQWDGRPGHEHSTVEVIDHGAGNKTILFVLWVQ